MSVIVVKNLKLLREFRGLEEDNPCRVSWTFKFEEEWLKPDGKVEPKVYDREYSLGIYTHANIPPNWSGGLPIIKYARTDEDKANATAAHRYQTKHLGYLGNHIGRVTRKDRLRARNTMLPNVTSYDWHKHVNASVALAYPPTLLFILDILFADVDFVMELPGQFPTIDGISAYFHDNFGEAPRLPEKTYKTVFNSWMLLGDLFGGIHHREIIEKYTKQDEEDTDWLRRDLIRQKVNELWKMEL